MTITTPTHDTSPSLDVTRLGGGLLHGIRLQPVAEGTEAVCLACPSVALIPRDSDIDPVLGCGHNQKVIEALQMAWHEGHNTGHAQGVTAGIEVAVSRVRSQTTAAFL